MEQLQLMGVSVGGLMVVHAVVLPAILQIKGRLRTIVGCECHIVHGILNSWWWG